LLLLTGFFAATTGAEAGSPREDAGKDPLRDLYDAGKTTLADAAYVYSAPARINTRSALWVGGFLAAGGLIYAYDEEIYEILKRNEFEQPYKPVRETGEFFEPLGFQGFTNQFIIGGLIVGYVAGLDPVVDVTADMIECLLVSVPAKNITMITVGRNGPSQEKGPRSFEFNDGRSFPSGHSLTIVTLASVLSHHVDSKPFSALFYGIAGTVLLQRITSDAHWPSDVFAGATIGWFQSHAILKRKADRRLQVLPAPIDEGKGVGMIFRMQF
jgi:hypothetical protein